MRYLLVKSNGEVAFESDIKLDAFRKQVELEQGIQTMPMGQIKSGNAARLAVAAADLLIAELDK